MEGVLLRPACGVKLARVAVGISGKGEDNSGVIRKSVSEHHEKREKKGDVTGEKSSDGKGLRE